MNATGMSRMKTVGKVLAGLEPKTHNALVAALSPRASPVERWGTDLSPYPAVVAARIESLQTGDLVVTSSGAGISWVATRSRCSRTARGTTSPWSSGAT